MNFNPFVSIFYTTRFELAPSKLRTSILYFDSRVTLIFHLVKMFCSCTSPFCYNTGCPSQLLLVPCPSTPLPSELCPGSSILLSYSGPQAWANWRYLFFLLLLCLICCRSLYLSLLYRIQQGGLFVFSSPGSCYLLTFLKGTVWTHR